MNRSVSLHLFLISSGGVLRECYLDVFSLAIDFVVFLLWYSTCPMLREDYCKGSLMFINTIIITYIIIVCIVLPGVAQSGGGDGFLFRPSRIPFLNVVRRWSPFASASGSVALAVYYYLVKYITYCIIICYCSIHVYTKSTR